MCLCVCLCVEAWGEELELKRKRSETRVYKDCMDMEAVVIKTTTLGSNDMFQNW